MLLLGCVFNVCSCYPHMHVFLLPLNAAHCASPGAEISRSTTGAAYRTGRKVEEGRESGHTTNSITVTMSAENTDHHSLPWSQ